MNTTALSHEVSCPSRIGKNLPQTHRPYGISRKHFIPSYNFHSCMSFGLNFSYFQEDWNNNRMIVRHVDSLEGSVRIA
jgi:hypothetical protein